MFSRETADNMGACTWDGKKMMSFNYMYHHTFERYWLENVRDLESCLRDRQSL